MQMLLSQTGPIGFPQGQTGPGGSFCPSNRPSLEWNLEESSIAARPTAEEKQPSARTS